MAKKQRSAATDRRSRRTEAAIEKAFLELITKSEINKISIKEITDLADTNRGTFYLHYIDIFDLQDCVEDKLIEGLYAHNNDSSVHGNGRNIGEMIQSLEYIRSNRAVFGAFLSSGRSMLFMEKITGALEKQFRAYLPSCRDAKDARFCHHVTVFFVNGAAALIRDWLTKDDTMSPAELANVIERLISFADTEVEK